jgi:hypothetical protein
MKPFISGKDVARSRFKVRSDAPNSMETGGGNFREPDFSGLMIKSSGHNLSNHPRLQAAKQCRALVEAIMLQALEDLWDSAQRKESISFFKGEGFCACAETLGMGRAQKFLILRIMKQALRLRSFPCTDK